MESNQLNNTPNEDVVIELLTLTCEVAERGDKTYKNKEGQKHRIHGPAVIANTGSCHWYKNGIRHRENGPAVTFSDGAEYYYINGKLLFKTEFIQWQKDNGIEPIE